MFIRILLAAILYLPTWAAAKECTQMEAYAAESVVDYLNNWHNLHLAYEQFSHCDDGAISEGFSESVARLLVDQWSQLNEFVTYSKTDKKFENFVLNHIDETLNLKDLRKIVGLAKTNCPDGASEFCKDISSAAGSANLHDKK